MRRLATYAAIAAVTLLGSSLLPACWLAPVPRYDSPSDAGSAIDAAPQPDAN
jgi:hypothetical protein